MLDGNRFRYFLSYDINTVTKLNDNSGESLAQHNCTCGSRSCNTCFKFLTHLLFVQLEIVPLGFLTKLFFIGGLFDALTFDKTFELKMVRRFLLTVS